MALQYGVQLSRKQRQPAIVRAFSFLMPTVWFTGAGAQRTGVDLILIAGPASRKSAKAQEALMAINALAAQAKLLPAGVVQRFLSTSSAYLGQPRKRALATSERSEFVDPVRYRINATAAAGRAR